MDTFLFTIWHARDVFDRTILSDVIDVIDALVTKSLSGVCMPNHEQKRKSRPESYFSDSFDQKQLWNTT